MDARLTNLQCRVVELHNAYDTKMQKLQGGRSRYTYSVVSSKLTTETTQSTNTKTQTFQGGRSRYKLKMYCPPSSQHHNFCIDIEVSGWTLALQTYGVRKVHNAYNAKIQIFQGGRSRDKQVVSFKFATLQYKDAETSGRTFTLQICSVFKITTPTRRR